MAAETVHSVYVDALGEPRSCALDELAGLQVEKAHPVRDFFAYPGQRTFQGWWWSATTRSLLAFESLLERQALMVFDFDPEVRDVAVQPFALLWPRKSPVGRSHVPDLFAAERSFRRELAPRGVLVDSPLMLFALELAHLVRPGSSPISESSTDQRLSGYLRAALYAVQVRWAQTLIDPAVRAGLTGTLSVRATTIARAVDKLSRLRHIRWEPSRELARVQIRWASPGGGYVYLDDKGDDPEQEIETWRVSQGSTVSATD